MLAPPSDRLFPYTTLFRSRRFLESFQGYLHVDGYAGYNGISGVTLVGCWAHARRKFTDALKALPASAKTSHVKAKEGLSYRSEERRVGKECRSRWRPYDEKKKEGEARENDARKEEKT